MTQAGSGGLFDSIKAGINPAPLPAEDRQQVYQNLPRVVSLQDPGFSDKWLGSYATKPNVPDNKSEIPAAFQATPLADNKTYGVNKQWAEAPVIEGSSLGDRLKDYGKSTVMNSLVNPDPTKNIVTNPLAGLGNLVGGKTGDVISTIADPSGAIGNMIGGKTGDVIGKILNPLKWF